MRMAKFFFVTIFFVINLLQKYKIFSIRCKFRMEFLANVMKIKSIDSVKLMNRVF